MVSHIEGEMKISVDNFTNHEDQITAHSPVEVPQTDPEPGISITDLPIPSRRVRLEKKNKKEKRTFIETARTPGPCNRGRIKSHK